MRLILVTGASRGLGQALARAALGRGDRVIGFARSRMDALSAPGFTARRLDLANSPASADALAEALAGLDAASVDEAILINNAGTVDPVRPAERVAAPDATHAVALNLATPIALTGVFLRATAAWRAARKVLNISSGAAHTAYEGWSVYCATKAGLDHYTRCAALEQARASNPARLCALAPGVVDTDMQTRIRAASGDDFHLRERFVALHANGQLAAPAAVADRILDYLARADFGLKPVADLRTI